MSPAMVAGIPVSLTPLLPALMLCTGRPRTWSAAARVVPFAHAWLRGPRAEVPVAAAVADAPGAGGRYGGRGGADRGHGHRISGGCARRRHRGGRGARRRAGRLLVRPQPGPGLDLHRARGRPHRGPGGDGPPPVRGAV